MQRDRWANEFAQQPDQWANEFDRTQTGATATTSGQGQADAKSQQDTKALAEFLGQDANPKMKNSKFLQFISKMSRGEIILEDNQVMHSGTACQQNMLDNIGRNRIQDQIGSMCVTLQEAQHYWQLSYKLFFSSTSS